MKAFWIMLGSGVLLPLLAWTSVFLYWHVQITRAVRIYTANNPSNEAYLRAVSVLEDGGCRCLPYLVGAVDASTDPGDANRLILEITRRVNPMPNSDAEREAHGRILVECQNAGRDDPEDLAQKAVRLRSWWSDHGHKYHQWWRAWSSDCSGGTSR
jgi:hypothetical protein